MRRSIGILTGKEELPNVSLLFLPRRHVSRNELKRVVTLNNGLVTPESVLNHLIEDKKRKEIFLKRLFGFPRLNHGSSNYGYLTYENLV